MKAVEVGKLVWHLIEVLDEAQQSQPSLWRHSLLRTLCQNRDEMAVLVSALSAVALAVHTLDASAELREAVLSAIRTAQAAARTVAALMNEWIAESEKLPDEPPHLAPELTGARWDSYVAAWRDRSPGFVKKVLEDSAALERGQHLLASLPDGEWEQFLLDEEEVGVEMTAEEFEKWAATGELPCHAPSA